jgi:hypothetical protein
VPEPTGIVIDSLDECIEKTTTYMGSFTQTVKLDTAKGVIAEYLGGKTLWAYRYDANKRLVAVAYWQPNPDPPNWAAFQKDYLYDASGHIEDVTLTYSSAPPFYSSATATGNKGWSVHYTNAYQPNGALAKSVVASSSSTSSWTAEYVFVENATTARCDEVELSTGAHVQTEKRIYDTAGRITRADKYGMQRCGLAGDELGTSTRLWTYDTEGRLTNASFWCRNTPLTDPPSSSTTVEYFADGSQRVEKVDRTTDVAPVGWPTVIERSAYCAVIDAWRGGPRKASTPETTRCTMEL